jgi:putative tricarboxylic transport membrane protein
MSVFDLYLMIGIAVLALALRLFDFPLAPLLLGFILGGMLEDNLRRTLLIYDSGLDFLWERPQSLVIALLCVGALCVPLFRK